MTVREAFERGTDTFNAHDLDGFADVLADDVASHSMAAGSARFLTRTWMCTAFTSSTTSPSRKAIHRDATASLLPRAAGLPISMEL
jgi:hypothetical protein